MKYRISILLLVSLFLLFNIVSSIDYSANVPLTTVVLKKPYSFLLGYDEILIKMLPGTSDYRKFDISAYEGNKKTNVIFNFTDNITQICDLSRWEDSFSINETHYYTLYIDSFYVDDHNNTNSSDDTFFNFTLGNYNGLFNVTVVESGISNYTNITIQIVNDSIGRVLVNVTDNAGQPLENAKVTVYFNMSVNERGYTDENGIYYTHFYDYNDYLLFSIRKTGYMLKGYSVKISEALHKLSSELKGTPKLEWLPDQLYMTFNLLQDGVIQVALTNVGTGIETNINLNSTDNQLFRIVGNTEIDEIAPGSYVNVSIYVLAKWDGGIYGGYIEADAKWSDASLPITVLVGDFSPDSTGSSEVTDLRNITLISLPKPSVNLFINVNNTYFELSQGLTSIAEEDLSRIIVKMGYSKRFFLSVKNDGEVDLTDIRLSAENFENISVSIFPDKYTELKINESKNFLIELEPLSETNIKDISLKLTTQTYSTIRTLVYEVISDELTINELREEYLDFNSSFNAFKNQINKFKIEGGDTIYAENYLNLIEEKLIAVEAALDAENILIANAWLGAIAEDFTIFVDLIKNFSIEKQNYLLVYLIFSVLIMFFIFILFKKKNKLIEYNSIIKKRFLTWWMLKKLR
ncbi:MAG: hypothetical protein GON13_03830 [Nanoarchaeota archaeon]|nr:hypothetical protein [Nanoarchaeota archaeon]